MAPILGADGKPLAAHGWFDVESLTERDGLFYIGIERVHKIVRFDFKSDGRRGAGGFFDVVEQQGAGVPDVRAEAVAAGGRSDRGVRTQS